MTARTYSDNQRLLKNHSVTSKCLAIVLQETSKADNENLGSANTDAPTSVQKAHNGKDLFDDFKLRNKTCYWNPSLIESIKNLGYLGFVEPSTILVGGSDIHLENLRSAWGRRVLKAPAGFSVVRIGDVNGIEMQVIPQTQFIPLPDALCLIIMDLNNQRVVATLDTIFEKLQQWYGGMTMPDNQLIFNTLSHLVQERKIFHTGGMDGKGSGYFIVTPDTYRMQSEDPGMTCNASWLPYHPMYIPVFPPIQGMQQLQQLRQIQQMQQMRAPMRSISCQANMYEKLTSQVENKPPPPPVSKARPRSSSARGMRNKEKEKGQADIENDESNLKRTMSVKYKTDKATAITKDVNLKSSNINQTKQKGEKVSLFSKLFKKNKKKNAAPAPAPKKEAEYATFSAQFPPPEWQWYKQQVEKQRRTEEWVSQQGLGPGTETWETQRNVRPKSWFYLQNMVPDNNSHDQTMAGIPEDRENTSFEKKCTGKRHKTKKEKGEHSGVQENGVVVPDGHQGMELLSPISANEDIYQSVGSTKTGGPNHSTPRFYDTIPPRHNQSSVCDNEFVKLNNQDVEVVSRHHNHHHRRSHRARRKSHRNSCVYDSRYNNNNNDISYEYNGRLPNKNSVYAASKDSGVNCIGQTVKSSSGHHHDNTAVSHRKENIVRNKLDEVTEEGKVGGGVDDHFASPLGEVHSEEFPGSYAPQNSIDPNYYDSSINESFGGGNSAAIQIVCEAEINHQPIPQIVLDSELQAGCYDPDVAKSNSGSRDALSSEKSFDTVIAGKSQLEDEENKDTHLETINSNIRDLSFVDSGFSSPRNAEQPASDSGKQNVRSEQENKSQNSKQNNCTSHAKEVCCSESKHRPVPHLYPHVMNNQRPSRSSRCETQHYANVDDVVQHVCPQTPEQLQLFKQQQLNTKRFGLNGEFEVVGVV